MRALRFVLLVPLALASIAEAAPNQGPFEKIAVIRLRDTSANYIDEATRLSVLRRLEMARTWGADCIIFDIESYGGMVVSSVETGDEIFALGRRNEKRPEKSIHTLAYVGRKAISGAAMIAVSCQEIVMSEAATLGDSQVVGMDGSVAPEKYQTTVAATFRKYADGNGYPVALAESMVRIDMEVSRYKRPRAPKDGDRGFDWVYYRTDDIDDGPSAREIEEQQLGERERVVRAGQLATFTAKEAQDYGFVSRLEPTLDDLITSIKADGGVVQTFEWTAAERTARWLLGIRGLLFLIGLGSLYFALKMPGTGIPEVLALVCFGLFFGASWIAHLAGPVEVILFFVGIGLIALEIFVIPGFGIPGFAGLLLIFLSIGMAAVPEGGLPAGGTTNYLVPVARDFLIGAIGAVVLVFFLMRHLPSVPLFRKLHLSPPAPAAVASTVGGPDPALVGTRGVAATNLRPAGAAMIDGERRDVVAESGYVDADTPVRVVAVRGNAIVVRAEPPTA